MQKHDSGGGNGRGLPPTGPRGSNGAHPHAEAIARRAYQLFEARGREPGHELDDWVAAETEIAGASAAPGAEPDADLAADGGDIDDTTGSSGGRAGSSSTSTGSAGGRSRQQQRRSEKHH